MVVVFHVDSSCEYFKTISLPTSAEFPNPGFAAHGVNHHIVGGTLVADASGYYRVIAQVIQ